MTAFSLGTTICQRFTNVSCLRSHHKEKNWDSSDPRSRLFIVGIFFFLLHDEMTLAVSKDALCFVKQRKNEIVLTIGALLHYTDVEL